ncbi:hypothetical protein H0H92_007788, partial [Tricholoma furcatifolium]
MERGDTGRTFYNRLLGSKVAGYTRERSATLPRSNTGRLKRAGGMPHRGDNTGDLVIEEDGTVLSVNSLAEETLNGESSRLGGYTLEEQQAGGGGSGNGYKHKGRSEARDTGRSRDGGSDGGDDGSDDSDNDDDEEDRRRGGGDRGGGGGGGKGHGDDDPDSDDSGDHTKRSGERLVVIPINSILEVQAQDGEQEFEIRSTIKATIRTEGRLNHHWPGQTIEVDIQPLQVDLKTFADYRVGLGQIQISAPSSSEMTILLCEPEVLEHDEPVEREGHVKRSFKASLSASSTPAKGKMSRESSKTVR